MDGWRKKFIIISGFLEALVFSGCLFGWPSLLLILQEEGIYRDMCPAPINGTQRNGRLNTDSVIHGDNDSFGESQLTEALILSTEVFSLEEKNISSEIFTESHEKYETVDKKLDHNDKENCTDKNNVSISCARESDTIQHNEGNKDLLGCDQQRVQMTLIYTFAAVAYGISAILIGMSLDVLGLRVTRLTGSTLICLGFLFLAYTTPERSYFLWFALNLIALGTNQLRLSGFQFAELSPEYRATILTAYSSAYSISTTFFLVIQLMYENHISRQIMFLCSAGLCALTYIPTFFMPTMKIHTPEEENKDTSQPNQAVPLYPVGESAKTHDGKEVAIIPNGDDSVKKFLASPTNKSLSQLQVKTDNQNQVSDGKDTHYFWFKITKRDGDKKPSFLKSLFSVSGLLHIYWHFINLFLILFYSSTLNIWASKVTSDIDQESFYIKMSGVCCLIAPIFVPVIGIVTDKMISRAEKRPNQIERLAYTMQAPTFAMTGATIILALTMICKMFLNETAIYSSLILIALSRPAVVGSCTAYIRMRFPPKDFNILNGIFTTIISVLCFVQYPIMKWMTSSPEAYNQAHWLLLLLLVGSLASPIHMMFRRNIIYYAKIRLGEIN